MHAVAPHFPHDFSAELMSHRGVDEQATETTHVTRLRNVGPSTFFPIQVKLSFVFHALNVDPALRNRQRSILGRVDRELVEDQSQRSDLVCVDWNIHA